MQRETKASSSCKRRNYKSKTRESETSKKSRLGDKPDKSAVDRSSARYDLQSVSEEEVEGGRGTGERCFNSFLQDFTLRQNS